MTKKRSEVLAPSPSIPNVILEEKPAEEEKKEKVTYAEKNDDDNLTDSGGYLE
jgi:hypothetical protein